MVLQVGRSTSTGKSSEARSANGLKGSRVSSQARIKIPCPAQPAALTTIPRWQPLAAQPRLGWNKPPDPPLECLRKPPASPADALTTSVAPKEHPHGGNGLKSTLRGFSNGLSLRQSCSRGSHSIRAKRSGTRRSKPGGEEAPLARRKKPVSPPVSLQFHPPAPKPSRDPLGQNCLRRSP